jgi:hypothetical protein
MAFQVGHCIVELVIMSGPYCAGHSYSSVAVFSKGLILTNVTAR